MIGQERRQTPRTTVEGLAYINIEPDNGGIVLNVSEGGLGFHSVAPVQRNGTVRFWFLVHNHRIEANGELSWTDETQKAGGLRFTGVPAEAREQIRNWISQPTTPFAADEASAPSVSPPPAFPALSDTRPDTKAAPVAYVPLAVVSPEVKVPTPLSGFGGGLATGLLISALVGAAFLFHTYRRQFGESLIQLGERWVAQSQTRAQTVSPAQQGNEVIIYDNLSTGQKVLPARRPVTPTPAPIPVPPPQKLPPQPLASPVKPQQAKVEPVGPAPDAPTAAGRPAPKAPDTAGAAAISSTPPSISLPTAGVAPNSSVIPGKLGPVPQLEPNGSTSEMYFEIGKFKDELEAHQAADRLAQLGFHATVIQRGHLWMNSYYGLVGPYRDDEAAEAAHKSLVSHGFKPRAFERGSRNFTVDGGCDTFSRLLRSGPILNGTHMPGGDCTISWESYSSHASVKFVQGYYVIATADGKWVKRGVSFKRDAYVYRKNGDGSRTLVEIWFAGMSQALVFGKSS